MRKVFMVVQATIFISFWFIVLSGNILVLPPLDQTGNLIQNGNFETGSRSPWRTNDDPTVAVTGDHKVDGEYAAFIDTTTGHPGNIGNWVVGLWQYPGYDVGSQLPPDTYTLSGSIQLKVKHTSVLPGIRGFPVTTLFQVRQPL